MIYLGDFPTGAVVYVPFHTFDANGASVTLTGLAVTDIEIYKNGSTTQRASDAGYTLLDTDGTDFDGLTGLHGFSIDLSDNTDAGFYAAGNEYMVAVSAVTVDSQTVSFWAATFSIERAGGALALLKNATYGLSALETIVDDLEGRLTAARAGYLDNINNAALATTVAQTGDAYARLGAPVGASISADVAAVKTQTAAIEVDTQDLQTQIGTAGAGLTAIPWNAAWDAEVQSEAADALNAYDPPTNAEMEARTLPAANYFDPAADTVASVTTVGSVTGAVGSVTGAVGSVAVGGITAASIAINAIDADAIAADAVTKLQSGLATAASIAALNNISTAQVNAEMVDVLRIDTIPDSYAADGAQPTIAQAILAIQQFLMERAVSGTTVTVKKPDGSTTAMTFTLDDGTNPTAITRAA